MQAAQSQKERHGMGIANAPKLIVTGARSPGAQIRALMPEIDNQTHCGLAAHWVKQQQT